MLTVPNKYSPHADKIIVRLSDDTRAVTVGVQDFGIGIASQHQNRIFDRFYQVDEKTSKTYPGLGIGLYISSEIIQRHKGKIWVESETGKGSLFQFTIPITAS